MPDVLHEGDFALDLSKGSVGQVVRADGQAVVLAPLDDGDEWEVPADCVRRARTNEELLAKVHVYNEPRWDLRL